MDFVIDDETVDSRCERAFSMGQCHGLALAVSARTGWPMRMISTGDAAEHVVVQMPDGRLLDARGPMHAADLLACYPEASIVSVTEDDLYDLEQDGWAYPEPGAAGTLAKSLLGDTSRTVAPAWESLEITLDMAAGLQLRFSWFGGPNVNVWARELPEIAETAETPEDLDDWKMVSQLMVPTDPMTERYLVEFSAEVLQGMAEDFTGHADTQALRARLAVR